MKNNEFYHTNVEIKEYPFNKIYLEELNDELIKNVKLFNSSKDIEYKKEIAKHLPIDFPKCRFCGDIIINSNFKILLKQKEKYIQIINPSVWCREIDSHKYYLSCCKTCLLQHFKDNPPKAEKYFFMKANIYGQYCFGYSYEEYKKICSMTVAVTENRLIKKYGETIGKEKWKEYCDKQAKSNSFEYKKEKYNWSKEKFDNFNKNRAVTKELCIKRYGDERGLEVWNNYCEKQKITKSFDYMINKYGYDKAVEINKSKALILSNFIKKYGEKEGYEKFTKYTKRHKNFYSLISQELFNKIDKYFSKKYTTYYATKNYEYMFIINDNTYICLDYYIKELNACIEFNGSVFHAEPRLYNDDDKCNPFSELTAKEIRENDQTRYKSLKELYNIDTYIVWEYDYRNNKDKVINDILKYYNLNSILE